jgi:hypothetical protein
MNYPLRFVLFGGVLTACARNASDSEAILPQHAHDGAAVSVHRPLDHVDLWELWRHAFLGASEADRAVPLVDLVWLGGLRGHLTWIEI